MTVVLSYSGPNQDFITGCGQGDEECVRHSLSSPNMTTASAEKGLYRACMRGRSNIVLAILAFIKKHGVSNPTLSATLHRCCIVAAEWGHTDIVKTLLTHYDAKSHNDKPLMAAVFNGHTAVFSLLYPLFDAPSTRSEACTIAAQNGHEEIVRQLLPYAACAPEVLRAAAQQGHVSVVALLLSAYGDCVRDNAPMCAAAENNQQEVMELLWTFSTPEHVLRELEDSNKSGPGVDYLRARCLADVLQTHTGATQNLKKMKKL